MKIISDIRIFKDINHKSFENKKMNLSAHRVAMKLREKAFSLGEYDHLYLCFSSDKPEGSVLLDEKADSYFPWFRNVLIGIAAEELLAMEKAEEPSLLLRQIENVLIRLFGSDSAAEKIIRDAIEEANKGAEMLMRFKEKKAAKGTAVIYLRLLDNAYYLPLLSVTNADGTEILRENLPKTLDLRNIGEILLSSKKVTVKPRKNAFTKGLKPISFEIRL